MTTPPVSPDMTAATVPASAVAAPAHPNRRTARTVLALLVALAPTLPSIIDAMGLSRTLPVVAVLLAVAAGFTRVLALPQTELLLRRFAPWLSASDVAAEDVVAQSVDVELGTVDVGGSAVPAGEASVVVAGDAHAAPTGTPVRVIDVGTDAKPRPRKRAARRTRRGA